MAGFLSDKPGAPITSINVTPLVDITLVLLIIFMLTAKLVVSRAIPLDLPRAASGSEVQTVFSVALRADGATLVNGALLPREQELFTQAQRARSADPELRAVVQADGKLEHARVMRVLDVLRQAGVTRVAFAVEPGPSLAAEPTP